MVTDSITSDELRVFLENDLGLRHLRYKRGYRNVINKAQELRQAGEDAFLAIETSGHCAFSDNYFMDDGAFLAVNIIVAAAKIKKESDGREDIRSLISSLKTPAEAREFRLDIVDPDFQEKADEILAAVESLVRENDCLTLVEPNFEGIRVNYSLDGTNGWFLARKSLHDPVLPVNIESEQEGGVEKAAALLADCLGEIEGVDLAPLGR